MVNKKKWLYSIPDLVEYSRFRYLKIIGPLLTGLEFKINPHSKVDYNIYFVFYPLWKSDIKSCLNIPIVFNKIHTNFSGGISKEQEETYFYNILENVRQQTILFENEVKIEMIFSIFDKENEYRSEIKETYLFASLLEKKIDIANYISNNELIENIQNQIKNINWDSSHFKRCGIDLNNWIEPIKNKENQKDELLKNVELNKSDIKLAK